MLDVLIVGQGIAGTMMGFSCLKKGLSFKIIDNPKGPNASLAAAALVEPLSGKRWALSYEAQKFIPVAKQLYQDLEKFLSCSFMSAYPTYRFICNTDQQTFYYKRKKNPLFHSYLGSYHQQINSPIKNHLGAVTINQSFSINSPLLLQASRNFFDANKLISNEDFDYNAVKIQKASITYGKTEAKNLVFCQGAGLQKNPFFNFLEFRLAKGETLALSLPKVETLSNLSFEKWLIPAQAGLFYYGSTYDWEPFSFNSTSQNKKTLLLYLERYLSCSYKVLDQRWGIRCYTPQSRPLCMQHPTYKQMFVLGALGSKGFMSAPFLAEQLSTLLNKTT